MALDRLSWTPPAVRAERRPAGTSYKYRIFSSGSRRGQTPVKMVAGPELITQLRPIIEDLKHHGKQTSTTINIIGVAQQAVRLQRLLDEWTE